VDEAYARVLPGAGGNDLVGPVGAVVDEDNLKRDGCKRGPQASEQGDDVVLLVVGGDNDGEHLTMTGTTHALIGAALGRLAGRPGRAFAAGVASHFLLDRLPHRDYKGPLWLLLDGCGTLAVLAAALMSGTPGVLAGAIGGIVPDVEHLGDTVNPEPQGLFPSHRFRHGARSLRQGLLTELLVATSALLLLRGLWAGSADASGSKASERRCVALECPWEWEGGPRGG
jgi:hypothetical protein